MPVGLVVGGVGAWFAVAARRAFDPPTDLPTFVRRAILLPLDIAADAVVLARLLVSRRVLGSDPGSDDEVRLDDDDAVRAWAVLLTSAAPGSLAVEVEERDEAVVLRRHRLTRHDRATAELGHR
ncbi:MAG TPA: hypothetical protein VFM08_13665 [Nocardioides sp.]|nr:hypothetical protein [Nocardioides sp.]